MADPNRPAWRDFQGYGSQAPNAPGPSGTASVSPGARRRGGPLTSAEHAYPNMPAPAPVAAPPAPSYADQQRQRNAAAYGAAARSVTPGSIASAVLPSGGAQPQPQTNFSIPSLAGGETVFGDAGATTPLDAAPASPRRRPAPAPTPSPMPTTGPDRFRGNWGSDSALGRAVTGQQRRAAAPEQTQRRLDRMGNWSEGRPGEAAIPELQRGRAIGAPVPEPRDPTAGFNWSEGADPTKGFNWYEGQDTPAHQAARAKPGRNQYVDHNGVVQTLSDEQAAPERPDRRITAPGSTAGDVQGATRRAVDGIRDNEDRARGMAMRSLNPMSMDSEMMRRLENSQGSYFHKGSPSARRAVAEAYLGQMGALQGASQQAQKAGDTGYLDGMSDENRANEGAAQRRMGADMFNVGTEMEQDKIAAAGAMTPERLLEMQKMQQDMQIEAAKAQREGDAFEQGRPEAIDKQIAARRDYLVAQGASEEEAAIQAASEARQAGVDTQGSFAGRGAENDTRSWLDNLFSQNDWGGGLGDGASNTDWMGRPSADKDFNAYNVERTGALRRFITGKRYAVTATDTDGTKHKRYTDDESRVDGLKGLRR